MKALIAACAFCLVPMGGAAAGPTVAGGLEYDEISFTSGDAAAHPPGAFDADLAAVKTATLNGELGNVAVRQRMEALRKQAFDPLRRAALMAVGQVPYVGTLGLLIASTALRAQFQVEGATMVRSMSDAYKTEQRLGKWYHVVYLNGWTRREDVANQTVLIIKPDANQRLYLDLATQTYYTTPATDEPRSQASTRAVMCSPSVTVDQGPRTLGGLPTEVFQTTFSPGQMSAVVTRYASSYGEPPERTATGDRIPFDCLAGPSHSGAAMPTDRVALYQTMTVTSGAMVMSSVDEIGDVKPGDQDEALFEVPPGFREKHPGDPMHP